MRNNSLRLDFLKALHIVQYSTIYNLAPFLNKKARSFSGSLCQARVLFRWALKHGLIKPIKTIGRDYTAVREQFYCLTKKGARFIDAHDYKNIVIKSIHNAGHESAKVDCCLSFVFNYPSCDIKIRYPATKDFEIKPDAIITVSQGNKQYDFFLEVERSREAIQIVNDKIKKYETFNFRQHGFSDKTKVLFVISHKRFDPFWRPIQYGNKQIEIQRENEKVKALVNLTKNHYIKKYRITGLTSYQRLHRAVWYDTNGSATQLLSGM